MLQADQGRGHYPQRLLIALFLSAIQVGERSRHAVHQAAGQCVPGTIRCSVTTTTTYGCFVNRVSGTNPYAATAVNPAGYSVRNFLNPAAFANAPVATVNGQTDYSPLGGGPSQFRGPAYRRLDFSIFKNFRVSERFTAQFRAEAFNLTNTPNFSNPSTTSLATPASFGQITTLRDGSNGNRQIQLAGKLYF